jgi:hypothetical protein
MKYHNVVKAIFAFCCVFMLQSFIGISGDLIFSPAKAKVQGYVVTTAPATVHKYVPRT